VIRTMFEKIMWMIKRKDCRHVCLWCKYYDQCRNEEDTEDEIHKKK